MKLIEELKNNISVAVLYQAEAPPSKRGIKKPMKPGGYSDSGADIAFALNERSISVKTPSTNPSVDNDYDWIFPDTHQGIKQALSYGANVFWLNTVLFEGHPIDEALRLGISVVGQDPVAVDTFDDKLVTNTLLKGHQISIPESITVTNAFTSSQILPFDFPAIIKPIRGRGSQGVVLAINRESMLTAVDRLLREGSYGDDLYLEMYLPGHEITITIMPPGEYIINNLVRYYNCHWALPAVKRFNHQNGIAPYNGTIAVVNNSKVLTDEELEDSQIRSVTKQCELAASLVNAKAPIRIDCRADENGKYFLFDLNMKPNMTGPSRPHRMDQDSLTSIAARKIGWSFSDMLLNMLMQRWRQ